MKSANLKIQRLPKCEIQCDAISVQRNSGELIGTILCSGEFLPEDSTDIYIAEIATILNVMENFALFFDNIETVTN